MRQHSPLNLTEGELTFPPRRLPRPCARAKVASEALSSLALWKKRSQISPRCTLLSVLDM